MAFPHACPIADRYRWLPDTPRPDGQTFHGGALHVSRGLVLHVQEGDNEPANWWLSPSNRSVASTHFWVAKDGTLVQYVGADIEAWAECDGNGSWHSVETEGFHGEPLTDAQIATLGRLYAWGHGVFGWPLAVTDSISGYGLGTHQMGGAAWGGHPCPGSVRAGQRQQVVDAAAANPIPGLTPASPPPVPSPAPANVPPAPPAPPVPQPWQSLPVLEHGMANSEHVRGLQRFLNRYNWVPALPLLPVTGNYLDMTQAVVKAAQAQCGVRNPDGSVADGSRVGDNTRRAFYARGARW